MLRTLRIRNLAVVEDVSVDFGPGLNLLTGETGAGKSILVDALSLISGSRANSSLVRADADRALVEAVFDVPNGSAVAGLIEARGIPVDDELLVIRRELSATGGGRAFLNDSPCTLASVREIGESVIDLLGQHEHHALLSRNFHQELLDEYAGHGDQVDEVRHAYAKVRELRDEIEDLYERRRSRTERAEVLRSQVSEIDDCRPTEGERDSLERERRLLLNAGRLAELAGSSSELLYTGDRAAASLVASAHRRLVELAEIDPSFEERARRLEAARVEIEDVAEALREHLDGGKFDPDRIERVESRLAALDRVFLRYGEDEAAVLAHRAAAAAELAELGDVDAEIERLTGEIARSERSYAEAADRLGERRRAAARKLEPEVERALSELALPRSAFRVAVDPLGGRAGGVGADGDVAFGPGGADRVEFLFSANPGEPPRPLARTASGGELSRVMLALHGVLEGAANTARRVLVFDEVDAGIGGAVADAVGDRLSRLAGDRQVLCVTHLPQVAAHADRHYIVTKRIEVGRTRTNIRSVAGNGRVDELARMLGGKEITAASRKHAAEMIRAAGKASRAGAGRTV